MSNSSPSSIPKDWRNPHPHFAAMRRDHPSRSMKIRDSGLSTATRMFGEFSLTLRHSPPTAPSCLVAWTRKGRSVFVSPRA